MFRGDEKKVKDILYNNKGLTLVEILATLVLIGIVFVGVMSIFPQMSLFNEKTYTKLDSMNLARQEMSELKELTFSKDKNLILNQITTASLASNPMIKYQIDSSNSEVDENNKPIHLLKKKEDGYDYELRFYENPKLTGDIHVENLYQVHLIVKTEEVFNSETFGYIKAN